MKITKFFGSNKGFSLIELMIVVGIIGILATLAVPKFQVFQAKARQTEAKTTLNQIYTLQESYFLDNNRYGNITTANMEGKAPGSATTFNCGSTDAQNLGLNIPNCNSTRYGYSVDASGVTTFTASAESGTGTNNLVYPGDACNDIWTMNNSRVLTHATGSAYCS